VKSINYEVPHYAIKQMNTFIYYGSDIQVGKSMERSKKYTRSSQFYQIMKGILWNRDFRAIQVTVCKAYFKQMLTNNARSWASAK
jgi:hypothetical protein